MVKVWGIKNCNSVKKALKFLDFKGVEYEFIDYRETPPSLQEINQWVNQVGIEAVLNTKGATYRSLKMAKQNPSLDKKVEWMSKYPMLIKRPILEQGEKILFGFKEEEYEELF